LQGKDDESESGSLWEYACRTSQDVEEQDARGGNDAARDKFAISYRVPVLADILKNCHVNCYCNHGFSWNVSEKKHRGLVLLI
jgi:hypothetical protein